MPNRKFLSNTSLLRGLADILIDRGRTRVWSFRSLPFVS